MKNSAVHSFQLPSELHASTPVEIIHGKRDNVRLMILNGNSNEVNHHSFDYIIESLSPNDLLILNTSRTIPSSLLTIDNVEIRLSRKIDEAIWDVLIVGEKRESGGELLFNENVKAIIIEEGEVPELTRIQFSIGGNELLHFFYQYGEPIKYEYIDSPWALQSYQTVYSSTPGSVEMNSAGRAFTWRLLQKLMNKGVKLGYICLHTGLSYFEDNHWPDPTTHAEWFSVPKQTVDQINDAKSSNNRIIAVGTTVVRALESAYNPHDGLRPSEGLTNLYINKETEIKIVDGLLTGFHEPEASHLDLLTAFVDKDLLLSAYQIAIREQYMWHEFGDLNLIWKAK
ncbi:S-adenosylmethionine:tRNA ribosyltransferase-isomerase [Alkalihalophilus lindianensis]|uniref:S-adenosylmethionine:tRNA ribosyltransferase-isomerase n=1 Tax=Alkalihalophilus lindianensis TaxID=1630542 RepID=A0ABU3XEL5_9BACI|nr:S-adenosylmethionine:tRNA ribosyltransferase-isomerase [Alkalihalophilus lindianensis]MDV2686337.1 S-adenosylmethionine:tRNA ribosyltransferase-isomerase [Alkalihalophilus lindianensis]